VKFRRLLAIGLAIVGAGIAAPATACVWLSVASVGEKPSHRDRAILAKSAATARLSKLRADLRERRVDPATELADMLIPNIRPVPIATSDCGDADEFDTLGGLNREKSNVFAGTELEGLDPDRFAGFYRKVGGAPGRHCNVEFRARFAAYLRARTSDKILAESYVTLANERKIANFRYYRFVDNRREPPLVTYGNFTAARAKQTPLWYVLDPERPVGRSIANFWTEVGRRVSDDTFACPVAHEDFRNARDGEIARLRAGPNYARLLKEAERARNKAPSSGDSPAIPPSVETRK
jgi:hypothetical protein